MEDDKTLWVGGLADQVTEDHLYELFLQAGPLEKVTRAKEKDGSLKKFAFVEFAHAESVPYAIQVMDGVKLFNHHLRLKGRTGSAHDSSRSDSPMSHSHSHQSGSVRGGQEFHRSRSFQGQGFQKHLSRSTSAGDGRKSNLPFSGPAAALAQPFSNTNSVSYNSPNMQPQSYEDRRNRLLHKQNMGLSGYSSRQGNQQYGGHNNYSQSFSGYSQHQPQQPQQNQFQNQHWYLNNY